MTLSILQRIAGGGDSGAMRECIDCYGALVWSVARRLTRTPADAEDATQEIFLQIWFHAARFDESLGSEKTFIAMIARRRLIDRSRKVFAEPPVESFTDLHELGADNCIDPARATETCAEVKQAMQALAELPFEHRQVLEAGILHGLSHPQIAKRLDIPLGTVKSYMRRGLIRIRRRMIEDVQQGNAVPLAICRSIVKRQRVVKVRIPHSATVLIPT